MPKQGERIVLFFSRFLFHVRARVGGFLGEGVFVFWKGG